MSEERQQLEYARPLPPSPDAPAYKRYSRSQLIVRISLSMVILGLLFVSMFGSLRFHLAGYRFHQGLRAEL